MSHGNKIIDRIARAADLQEEPLPGQPIVELAGDRRLLIEHHCGVTTYGLCKIQIKVKYGEVVVCGAGLELLKMTRELLVIGGRIDSIQLCRGRNG